MLKAMIKTKSVHLYAGTIMYIATYTYKCYACMKLLCSYCNSYMCTLRICQLIKMHHKGYCLVTAM